MSLFHHDHRDGNDSVEVESYEVLDADRRILRYARNDFAEIVQTTDPQEVLRLQQIGWVTLDERQVQHTGGGPTVGEDLIPGIEGLRAGGLFEYGNGETTTSYTMGILKEGAQGVPED